MNDNRRDQSVLSHILRASSPSVRPETNEAACGDARDTPLEDLGCFGWLNNPRDRADMLELQLKTGVIAALPYAWIDFAEFDPSEGIALHTRGSKTIIRGRNLNAEVRPLVRLMQGIIHRRVPWIRESDRGEDLIAVVAGRSDHPAA